MAKLRIRFTGMCTFVRNRDQTVDVRFPGFPPAQHGHGHAGHFPFLAISRESVETTSNAGPYLPLRVAGRPIHLYRFDGLDILLGTRKITGPVNLRMTSTFGNPSKDSEADWQDYRYLLPLEKVFGGAAFDQTNLKGPVVRLRGGSLSGDVPQTAAGTKKWSWSNSPDPTHITDVAVWETDVASEQAGIELPFTGESGSSTSFIVTLRRGVDANIWICHDPVPVGPRVNPVTIQHLEVLSAHFTGEPTPATITLEGRNVLNPDSSTCPPNFVEI